MGGAAILFCKLCIFLDFFFFFHSLQVVKVESGASAFTPSHSNELQFLRSRVRELERERAELSAENHRLKTMLVNGECSTPA